ncbi:homocysteine S-methyltransferase family protein [Microvirga lotononidis]|uniref:Homocysteine/selenocysteine methylase (S-methylmethionine-dependent) n=1 Tax=Microvirga lotononidis TaxID=864069 RepID=I4YNT4_9HYPH|nr:homocysteine S-methyltransferase family protein [Microvirga lotononidis]EIM25626.1 homocysteine/selenocysteine methylase (S-methylmethionine-dependent) [Microvirga lotononidis]WQO26488.1 homocysteine S-methyltransferase family protein [Microvirga lotononidis]
MTRHRFAFPPSDDAIFLTDGGLETTLVFVEGLDLPCFAAFPLLRSVEGRGRLERYFEPYIRTAMERDVGFILDTPTWRANADWGAKLNVSPEDLIVMNGDAVRWALSLRDRLSDERDRILINGVVGPRGDGYRADAQMTVEEAQAYHAPQLEAFRDAGGDMVSAITMNYAEEAIGIARAAKALSMPVVISFTVETDGRLASGETLRSAIERTDRETGEATAYYMINCAHPTHFDDILSGREEWTRRIRGLRANASVKSHAELDESTELDPGDPVDLGRHYRRLRERMPQISVLGGCCGTDHRHIAAICEACMPPSGRSA